VVLGALAEPADLLLLPKVPEVAVPLAILEMVGMEEFLLLVAILLIMDLDILEAAEGVPEEMQQIVPLITLPEVEVAELVFLEKVLVVFRVLLILFKEDMVVPVELRADRADVPVVHRIQLAGLVVIMAVVVVVDILEVKPAGLVVRVLSV
jgi:hypothetical protein